jgi:hypothetical protein
MTFGAIMANMALTNDDLQAIQGVIQTTVQPMLHDLEVRITDHVETMIDEAVDALAQSTAAGFAEVHEKIDQLDARVSHGFGRIDADLARIEHKLDATIDRVDDHAVRLRRLEAKPA